MAQLSSADHDLSPPLIRIPRKYNAAHDLIERNLASGRAAKIAYIDDTGRYSYRELAERVDCCAHGLLAMGLMPEQRVLLCLEDTIDFPTAFLACIKAGLVPVAVNTWLRSEDYAYILQDSSASALIASAELMPVLGPALAQTSSVRHVIVSRGAPLEYHGFERLLAAGHGPFEAAPTCSDDACFWLYSSGSTGQPKGTIHAHASLIQTAELYARPILGLNQDDLIFSAPKLFFAYGLGNALSFPLAVGATTVLMRQRPSPEAVFARLVDYQPSVFFGVPTLYAALLAGRLPRPQELNLRACVSAGEALPRELGERWARHFGVDIFDGIGSTEMLHIFLSNRPGDVCYGTTGRAVPGYELRLVDEEGRPVSRGELGELQVAGPTCAMAYWRNREKTRQTFQGPWVRSGDQYFVDAEGRYVYAGRSDDVLKVSAMYVSPAEVESALVTHPAVLEAAVVGRLDEAGLTKPLACVVLKQSAMATEELGQTLQLHVKAQLAAYKAPRWVEFLPALPKTATGKIQRFKLRAQFAGTMRGPNATPPP